MLFVGPIDRGVSFAIGKAVRDAGGAVVRTRSIGVPIDVPAVQDALRRLPAFRRLQGADHLDDLGNALADELAAGGKTPLWDALGEVIVQEREGPAAPPPTPSSSPARPTPSGVRPRRSWRASTRASRDRGPGRGHGGIGHGCERHPCVLPGRALDGRRRRHVGGPSGLVLLLGGAEPGSYGLSEAARDGVLPAIPPSQSPG